MRTAVLLLVATLGAVASGPGQGTPLNQAWQLATGGRQQEAVSLLRRLIEKEPRNSGARMLLGSLLTEQRQPEAVTQLKVAIGLLPRSAEAENALAEAYLALGDANSAQPALEKAVALEPANGIAQLNLGRLLLEKGQSPAARKHLTIAATSLKKGDDAAEAHYLLAKIATAQDDPANAVVHLQQAVDLTPKFAQAWSDLGAARQLQQDDAAALKAYERAVALNPNDAIAQYRFGSELLHEGDSHQAVEHLAAAYRLNPDDQSTLNALQTALRREGRSTEADQIRQKLADLLRSRDQKNQNVLEAVKLNNKGAALEKEGNLADAAQQYKEALALDPEHNGIRVNYAIALLRQGLWTEGLNQLHEASQREPDNLKIKTALNDALAQAPPGTVPTWKDQLTGK